ncbi:MAG: nickel pincer cofactor biosynthesis protein LarC [Cyanobacteriota bacterium]|jgi:uncharacterized protein (TIGR00299 family) protein
MKIAYFDCPTGISGDMCLGALADGGVPLAYLEENLARLGLAGEYRLSAETVRRRGQRGTQVKVELLTTPGVRHLREIETLIRQGGFSPRVESQSLAIFRRLAQAEGAVHGIEPERVHFHEVGATDALVDIVGTCLGLEYLEIEAIYCSAFPTGGGTVKAAHGDMAVPVPAVLKLWELVQAPIYDNGLTGELVTPTGAAIATTLARGFGAAPSLTLAKIACGAGCKDLPRPNLLRLWLGTGVNNASTETIQILETQLDDLTPQAVAYAMEQLYQVGAMEVFTQAIGMKKSRPGVLLTVLCRPEDAPQCLDLLFRETTTLGVRTQTQTRHILERDWETVATPYGAVRLKIGYRVENGQRQILNRHPEFADCAQLAAETGEPWQKIYQAALTAQ